MEVNSGVERKLFSASEASDHAADGGDRTIHMVDLSESTKSTHLPSKSRKVQVLACTVI